MLVMMNRSSRRFLKRVPLRFRPLPAGPEHPAESLNISTHGVYFATDVTLKQGADVQVRLKMPAEVVGEQKGEWCFTGRVTHVQAGRAAGQKSGVGVQFLYYEVPKFAEEPARLGSRPSEAERRLA